MFFSIHELLPKHESPFGRASNLSNQTLLQLGFTLLALIWEYDFPPFMVLIIAILNDGNTSNHFSIPGFRASHKKKFTFKSENVPKMYNSSFTIES